MLAAGLPQQVPRAIAHGELPVQLPAQLAGVGDALRPHRPHLADVQVLRGQVRERFVGDVLVGHGREHVARPRTPQPEAEQRAGALGDRHALAVADLRAQPGQVVLTRAAARHDPEQLLVLARHGQVAADPARRREHGRVHDRADRPVDPVGADALEIRERIRSRHVELRERRDVEERDALARGQVLGADGGRPVHGRPTLAALPVGAGEQLAVRLEPLRTLPTRAGEALRAERRVPLEERGQPKLARRRHLLERVQDVVDLAVLLRAARLHVRRRRLERVEAVRVGLGQVVAGLAVHHPLGDLLAHAAAVRDPHRLADPDAADLRGLADDGARVGREREHPVDRPLRVGGLHVTGERGEHAFGLAFGGDEVLRRERHQRRHRPVAVGTDVALRRDDRLVAVVADAVVVLAVPEVHRVVLVAQDRMDDLARLARQLGDRVGPHQLVLDGDERDRHAGQGAHGRAPDPRTDQDALALDAPPIGLHAVHTSVADVEPGDRHAALERHAASRRLPRERRDDPHRLRDAVARDEVRPEDRARVEQRDPSRRPGPA